MATEDNLVPVLADALDRVEDKKAAGEGMRAMMSRASEIGSMDTARLAGAAMTETSRNMVDDALTSYWQGRRLPPQSLTGEVIVGAGFHAAVYAATRVKAGKPKPVVVDMTDAAHIGGQFAVSKRGSWYLNSENRPGLPGFPADGDALNYLPGAMVQPADFDDGEFSTNAAMRYVIRATLAQYAEVVPLVKVNGIRGTDVTSLRIKVDDAGGAEGYDSYYATRVIDARGCGIPKNLAECDGERILTFSQFMAMADETFPYRDMSRVAVIGDGNSAYCVAEALAGIGPARGMRTMRLDGAPKVDMYSPRMPRFNESFRDGQRGRYLRLSSYLPSRGNPGAYNDMTVRNERAEATRAGDMVFVNGRQYTHAVYCTGFEVPQLAPFTSDYNRQFVKRGGRDIAVKFGDSETYAVGPAADLPFSRIESDIDFASITDNKVAMFRLAGPTAQLAGSLS